MAIHEIARHARRLRRSLDDTRLTSVLALTLAGTAAACTDAPAGVPTSPAARPALGLSAKDVPWDLNGDGKLSEAEKDAKERAEKAAKAAEDARKDAAEAAEKAAADSARAAKRLSKEEYERLKDEWNAYKKGVEKGNVKAEALRCEPSQAKAVTKRIGVKGGEIRVGAHTISIPAGALTSDTEITASEPGGPTIELQFAPHGLVFQKPVELSFDYKDCITRSDAPLGVVYVGNGWRVLETMPSTDKRSERRIRALTDHFSGYLVAWGVREDDSF